MSITIQIEGITALLAKIGHLTGGGLGGRATVGSNITYARYVHDGTRYMRARPFLADAAESQTPRVTAILGAGVRDLIEAGEGSLAPSLQAAGLVVQAEAQRNTPVRTGTLRRSEHTEVFSR